MQAQEFFAVKLQELDGQYRQLREGLEHCPLDDRASVRRLLAGLREECEQRASELERRAAGSRSPAVAELSKAQLIYYRQTRRLLEERLPGYIHSENSDAAQDRAEALALYAEFALDFAAQSMRCALLAGLSALDAQLGCDGAAPTRKEELL